RTSRPRTSPARPAFRAGSGILERVDRDLPAHDLAVTRDAVERVRGHDVAAAAARDGVPATVVGLDPVIPGGPADPRRGGARRSGKRRRGEDQHDGSLQRLPPGPPGPPSESMNGYLKSGGRLHVSLIVRGLTQRMRFHIDPALAFVPDAR